LGNAVAIKRGHKAIILGAWGCGVFSNDPPDVATWFADALLEDRRLSGAFDQIVFAVLDIAEKKPTYNAFFNVSAEKPYGTKR
jgi:uncharacterized protein (TIGR02452 family)